VVIEKLPENACLLGGKKSAHEILRTLYYLKIVQLDREISCGYSCMICCFLRLAMIGFFCKQLFGGSLGVSASLAGADLIPRLFVLF